MYLMSISTELLASVPAEGIDPKVTANNTAPWLPVLRDIAGQIMMTCIILLAIVLIIGVVLLVAGKLGSMSSAQSTGFMILVWGLLGAAVIGSVSGLVFWATTNSLAPKPVAAAVGSLLGLG
ncbi:MAG TPA: hypothetical protein DIT15_02035 [Arthrobacter bacterium]|jgi:hypothetical protein|nr:hypothetical protein [Arthrobacter sp.]HCN21026.1 hypothetical protein [Arthrobacter sp.]